jgi:hypothetical protein
MWVRNAECFKPVIQVEVFWVVMPLALVFYRKTTRCHHPEDLDSNHHRRESLKTHELVAVHPIFQKSNNVKQCHNIQYIRNITNFGENEINSIDLGLIFKH